VLALFALVNSLVQLQAHEEMRGRIMSVYHTAFRGAMPLGNLAIGAVAAQTGAPLAMSVSGGLLVLIAIWYLVRDKQVTQL
jgi:predicted MFS family arabinose efflux permease